MAAPVHARIRPWSIAGAAAFALVCLPSLFTVAHAVTTVSPGSAAAFKARIEAARVAATADGARFAVKVGNPVCPGGAKTTTPTVQCLVSLGETPVPYLVSNGQGAYVARPTFPLIGTAALQQAILAKVGGTGNVDCGKKPFMVMPVNSVARCRVGTASVLVRVVNPVGELRVETSGH
jgi:hypothetical protein